jgi:hypothetical protein
MYVASWESRQYLYQGFGKSKPIATNAVLDAYREMVRRVSGDEVTDHEIGVILDEMSIEKIQEGKTLINHGCEGWI